MVPGMGYRFRHDDESVEAGLRRIAAEQLTKALASLDADALHEGVHDARKRVKKLRGLLRLVRPGVQGIFEGERPAEGCRADAVGPARPYGDAGGAGAALGAVSGDRRAADGAAAPRARGPAGRGDGGGRSAERIAAFRDVLSETRERAEGWRLEGRGVDGAGAGARP
jgi:hypothetical protein